VLVVMIEQGYEAGVAQTTIDAGWVTTLTI
jgi:hypothetical protein